MPFKFAIIGVAGYVAPRHLKAISDTGNQLVAAADPSDSVGILDRFGFEVNYFREIERFDRHLDKLRRGREDQRVHYVSICSPNYLHDSHVRLALRNGSHAICEKPLVINPWNLDGLEELEHESGKRVFTILQLRVHPALVELKRKLEMSALPKRHDIELTYVTGRGRWYQVSWKGSEERSGGVGTNIGIHFFDLLLWLFGKVRSSEVHLKDPMRMAGSLELERANVRWFLSVDTRDLPFSAQPGQGSTFRSIKVDGDNVEFTEGFADLHTLVYERTLAGQGFGIADARPSIELVHAIRTVPLTVHPNNPHPFLDKWRR
jgi:UDP-N-acetyl-2-amino-2-deoxyglucuronate dehydrogenase